MTKAMLVHIIDSVFERDNLSPQEIDFVNYYANLLKENDYEPIVVKEFNLKELSFYSEKDELALFPPVKLDEMPASTDLVVENPYLSYFTNPMKGVITSNYGWRDGKLHRGIDIDLNKGDKVRAAFSGKVRFSKRQGGFGNVVIIMHPNGLETVYAHLSRLKVKAGDIVQSGQVIGLGGNTGNSRGSHLHFEVRYKGHPLNPGAIISFNESKLFHHTIVLKNSKSGLCAFPANRNLHKVSKGESWYIIAHKYGLTMKELMALNGVGRRYYLKVGQQLRIN
jgi:murein DD-endopeptidase MepM/ murein hydrolase activator NlpD